MLRTLTGIGIGLALVGSAHAQDRIVVTLQGKSMKDLRAELYRAAENVCADPAAGQSLVDSSCVESTYGAALRQLRGARPQLQRTAYIR